MLNEIDTHELPSSNCELAMDQMQFTTFERASEIPITLELPIKQSNDECDDSYSWKIIEGIIGSREIFEFILCKNYFVRYFVIISSAIGSVFHLIYQIYLSYKFYDTDLFKLLISSIFIIFFFSIPNGLLMRYIINNTKKTVCFLSIYNVFVNFDFILMVMIISDVKEWREYYIVSIVSLCVSLNAYGLYTALSTYIIVGFFIGFLIEGFMRFIVCNILATLEGTVSYNTYYYDAKRTTIKQCIICLSDYKDKDLICISKCNELHMFHERCIISWLV